MSIVRKLHQVWVGPNPIPDRERKWCEQMQRMNRGWKYTLHGNEAMERYASDPFLKLLQDEKRAWAFISDRLRVLILRDEGGVYCDIDCEPVQSLDSLNHVWDAPHVKFVTSARNPYRRGVALRGGVSLIDNTFMASAPNSRMIRHIESMWRAPAPLVNGCSCGQRAIAETDFDTVWLNFRYFYGEKVYPESIVQHDGNNLGSWVAETTEQIAAMHAQVA